MNICNVRSEEWHNNCTNCEASDLHSNAYFLLAKAKKTMIREVEVEVEVGGWDGTHSLRPGSLSKIAG